MNEESRVLVEREDAIAVIRLNDPEVANAVSPEMRLALRAALEELAQPGGPRALVLTGSGRNFCSGGNVRNFPGSGNANPPPRAWRAHAELLPVLTLRLADLPVIGAINGAAVGAGISIALGCDVRLAGSSTTFRFWQMKRGILPDYGLTYLLPEIVGQQHAFELMARNEVLNAEEAQRLGLVRAVVPDADLLEAAKAMAREYAQGPTLAIGLLKRALYQRHDGELARAMEFEANAGDRMRSTEDYAEAMLAFKERREPVFRGR
jgi:2-(1,2-epoxy-1,2-dihydrophenyl)acetyl-CoA isomerase